MERRPPWALSWHTILTWTDKEPNFHKRRFFCTKLLAPSFPDINGNKRPQEPSSVGRRRKIVKEQKRKIVKEQKRKNVKGEKRKRETKKEKEGIKNR